MQRHYKLRPSRYLSLLVSLLCFLSLLLLWSLPLSLPWSIVLSVVVLSWSGHCLLFDANLRMGHACVAFRLEEHDGIVLVLRNGRHLSGRVSSDSLVTPYVIILNVALHEFRRGRSLLIMPDTMGTESFRRLRVVLRWGN